MSIDVNKMHLGIICFIIEKHVHPHPIELVFNLKIFAEVYHLENKPKVKVIIGVTTDILKEHFFRFRLIDSDIQFSISH